MIKELTLFCAFAWLLRHCSSMTTRVELYLADEEISVEVTRALFEKVCESLFQKCLEAVKRCLGDAKVPPPQQLPAVPPGTSAFPSPDSRKGL